MRSGSSPAARPPLPPCPLELQLPACPAPGPQIRRAPRPDRNSRRAPRPDCNSRRAPRGAWTAAGPGHGAHRHGACSARRGRHGRVPERGPAAGHRGGAVHRARGAGRDPRPARPPPPGRAALRAAGPPPAPGAAAPRDRVLQEDRGLPEPLGRRPAGARPRLPAPGRHRWARLPPPGASGQGAAELHPAAPRGPPAPGGFPPARPAQTRGEGPAPALPRHRHLPRHRPGPERRVRLLPVLAAAPAQHRGGAAGAAGENPPGAPRSVPALPGLSHPLCRPDRLLLLPCSAQAISGSPEPPEQPRSSAGGASAGEEEEEEEDEDEESDDEGWITPSNLKQAQQDTGHCDTAPVDVQVGCVTTDFAMQNVLLQMGLPVLAVNGMLIRRARSYILRCHGCFRTTSDMTKVFCPHCGNKTLKKVAVSVSEDGTLHMHFSRNPKVLNPRGLRYPLPAPQGGKHANNPHLVEDQRFPQQRLSRKARQKTNVFDPDYLAGASPFAENDVHSRAAHLHLRDAALGAGRRRLNPNAVTKKFVRRR